MSHNHTTYLDAKGLNCPMPLVMLKEAVKDLPAGARVEITVTDVHAELDFEIWCERFGHQLNRISGDSKVWTFLVVVAGVEHNTEVGRA